MIDLTAEQRQLAKIVHDYTNRFPLTEDGDATDGLHLPTISWLFSFCEMDGATGPGDC